MTFRPFATACLLLMAAPPAHSATVQEAFDAAQAALDAGDYAKAREAFTALLARIPAGSQRRGANLVRARLGSALVATADGDAAIPLLETAIAGFKADTPQDAEERALALNDLARAREFRGELSAAAKAYRTVLDSKIYPANTTGDLRLRVALARTSIWSNPDEARRLLDGLLALPPETLGTSRDALALVKSLRGRVELNNGNPEEAKRWFTAAAKDAGGATTTKVSVSDVRVRGDLALANYKLGRMDEVQKAIAFSGAGSLSAEGLTAAASISLPNCAPLGSLAPDAVAVVEFSIADDGRVLGAMPIYASRGTGAADGKGPEEVFPAHVRRWSWNVEDVAKLDKFWRQAVRVELRCFTERPGDDAITASFDGEFSAWHDSRKIMPTPEYSGTAASDLPAMRAELDRREREHGLASPQLIPALQDLAGNQAAPDADRVAALTRQVALLQEHQAPNAMILKAQMNALGWSTGLIKLKGPRQRASRDGLVQLLNQQEGAGTSASRAGMVLRLRLAEAHEDLGEIPQARILYDEIAAAPQNLLAPADPIRTAALVHIANQEAAANDTDAAATALAATGLTPEQCSLVDIRPQAINTSISSSTFPEAAARWGTGGFVRVGYDITADGKPVNVRTIVASPPFIFGPNLEKAISRFEYRPVFRPGNTLGCTGTSRQVRFVFRRG